MTPLGMMPFDAPSEGIDGALMKCGRLLDGPYWSAPFGEDVAWDNNREIVL